MLQQKNNAVNPSRDLFILNKSANKIRAFNSAIPSDFSTITKPGAARIKKEALELVDLVSYALNQRALKIDVLDDEKKRIETTKHVSIIYYALNLIASQLETTAREISEKIATETEPTTTEPETEAPAPVVVVAADDRDDVMKEYLTKYDFKKADAVPNMLLDSINKGCPLWSFQWFGFAELPRRYFNGACFSVNNMILLAFHGGYYVSLTEARRFLGDKATPKEGAIARAVLRPVFKGAKNLRKSDLDALRNCEPIDDDTQQRRPDFYMVERVYDQTAFDGLELKKEKELPKNENERNAQAENIFRAFCKANNIGFLETEGNGQAVTQIITNGLGKVESITINMPSISQFKNATAYYSVLFHEATHAANAVNGCQLTKKREELSAEIGSCIVLNTLGFDPAEYIDDSAHYVQRFKDCANEKNAIKKAWKYAQASALLILDSFINEPETEAPAPAEKQETEPAPVATVEPKHEPKQEETPAPVKNDDEETIVSALESFEREATQAINTFGIVHQDNARRAENDALLAIEEARKNKSVPDDALKIYSDRVERIHVDTALALKAEATRRYGVEFIARHVTFC